MFRVGESTQGRFYGCWSRRYVRCFPAEERRFRGVFRNSNCWRARRSVILRRLSDILTNIWVFCSRIPVRGHYFGSQELQHQQPGCAEGKAVVSHWLRSECWIQNSNHQTEETRCSPDVDRSQFITAREGVERIIGVLQQILSGWRLLPEWRSQLLFKWVPRDFFRYP